MASKGDTSAGPVQMQRGDIFIGRAIRSARRHVSASMRVSVSPPPLRWHYGVPVLAPLGAARRRAGQGMEPSTPNEEARRRVADAMSGHLCAVALRGDRHAFEALFSHFGPRVKAYLMRLGGDAASAEELTQETFASIWRKAALFDAGKSSASTWIFTIARNLRIDAFRRERRPEIDPADPGLVPEAEPAADAVLEAREAERGLGAALAALGESERRLMVMAYYEDKSHTMIAAELGLPLGTVKSRIRQVFAKLRAGLGGRP